MISAHPAQKTDETALTWAAVSTRQEMSGIPARQSIIHPLPSRSRRPHALLSPPRSWGWIAEPRGPQHPCRGVPETESGEGEGEEDDEARLPASPNSPPAPSARLAEQRLSQIWAERKWRADVTAPGGDRAAGLMTEGADGAYVSPWKPTVNRGLESSWHRLDPATWPERRAGSWEGPAET